MSVSGHATGSLGDHDVEPMMAGKGESLPLIARGVESPQSHQYLAQPETAVATTSGVPECSNISGSTFGDTLKVPENATLATSESRNFSSQSLSANVAAANVEELYEETGAEFLTNYFRTIAKPNTDDQKSGKGAKLGTVFGVYLPTIQHILGVTMFIRLFWVVGSAGICHTALLLFVCCLCTFLTTISLAAVVTNGEMKSGGAYFMITRNLGSKFGTTIGILFYLGNAVAASMYLVGGVEILLVYICPNLTVGGREIQSQTGLMGMMSHNLRLYATILLLIEFAIVAMGVRFVQLFAPISLLCVILSILACYAGGITKTIFPDSGQRVCKLGDHLLQATTFMPKNASNEEICNYCNPRHISAVLKNSCWNGTCDLPVRCVNGYPGFRSSAFRENLYPSYMSIGEYKPHFKADTNAEVYQDERTSFFILLAIYFPAVTGILTGANMSGDLKKPAEAIPTGTFAAQTTTTVIYFTLALIFGAAVDGDVLRDKYGQSMGGKLVVGSLAWPNEWVLLIGSFTATFGAALQCLCSAPRLLQCIAQDDVIPMLCPLKKLTKNHEPFNALIFTTLVAELAILIGAMDSIAVVVDFFFLMCYAGINLICVMHSILKLPNWRPIYVHYHWCLSLTGAFLCFFIMFSTHWDYALATCCLGVAIYKYVEIKGKKNEWDHGMHNVAITTAQLALINASEKDHADNFRIQLMVVLTLKWEVDAVDDRYVKLLKFASQLKTRGLFVVIAFMEGNPMKSEDSHKAEQMYIKIKEDMVKTHLRGFAKVILYEEGKISSSIMTMVQSIGIGQLSPNTVLLKWPRPDAHTHDGPDSEYISFIDQLYAAHVMKVCMLITKDVINFPVEKEGAKGTIDAYWIIQDRGFLGLVSFILKQHRIWSKYPLRVFGVAPTDARAQIMTTDIEEFLQKLRINAKVQVVVISDPQISKTAFERTLLMEEGVVLSRKLRAYRMNQKKVEIEEKNHEKDTVSPKKSRFTVERYEGELSSDSDSRKKDETSDDDGLHFSTPYNSVRTFPLEPEARKSIVKKLGIKNDDCKNIESERLLKFQALDRRKVNKMHAAGRLNAILKEHSKDSRLIVLNLPRPPFSRADYDDYIHYLEELSADLQRVLFVRGGKYETFTSVI